jgi:transposase-like protein
MSSLNAPHFQDADKAREFLEKIRWPEGPVCPHCGQMDKAYRITGKSARPGLYRCAAKECGKQFTVTVGTVFERSKIPLHVWLQATYLLCSSKKGISSHQLHRMMGVTYKTAWFMTHRIREAMRELNPGKLGGGGTAVEVDETFIGGKAANRGYKPLRIGRKRRRKVRGWHHKEKVLSLVERGGRVRSYHVKKVTSRELKPIIREQVLADSIINTDEASHYKGLDKEFQGHETVNHSIAEYVRGSASTQAIENYFSILKRGLVGVYQHVGRQHLKRYIGEFDFRYNQRSVTDDERTAEALRGIEGKRLCYR